ncbi:hypothetical protein M413DRAFT_447029 [Hebeloma cylindrosporum]|uniref:Uncharacterized protein n=1 Tax=Hebeloma cylindrosporum TaxID=76867 RepID=A0A0C2YES9_HEBCY|nr:hypothetical protein M413DRAFT_447029 [Hebeloma cylindrosporum h7]
MSERYFPIGPSSHQMLSKIEVFSCFYKYRTPPFVGPPLSLSVRNLGVCLDCVSTEPKARIGNHILRSYIDPHT